MQDFVIEEFVFGEFQKPETRAFKTFPNSSIYRNKFNCSSQAWTGHFAANAGRRDDVILYFARSCAIN